MPMEAGKRDRMVTLEQLTESTGTSRIPVRTWTTLVDGMPASKQDISGRERMVADQLAARYDTRWEINYRPDMDPDLVDVPKTRRVVFSGRVFDIVSATQIGRRAGIELMTLAGSRI